MTELSISPDEIASALRQRLEGREDRLSREEIGQVVEAGDGIARIHGLPGVAYNELLDFGTGPDGRRLYGMALNLERDAVGAVILGESSGVE